MEEMTN